MLSELVAIIRLSQTRTVGQFAISGFCRDRSIRLNETQVMVWDVKFGIQIGSDWPQMGQIWDFLRSVSVHFAPRVKMY